MRVTVDFIFSPTLGMVSLFNFGYSVNVWWRFVVVLIWVFILALVCLFAVCILFSMKCLGLLPTLKSECFFLNSELLKIHFGCKSSIRYDFKVFLTKFVAFKIYLVSFEEQKSF